MNGLENNADDFVSDLALTIGGGAAVVILIGIICVVIQDRRRRRDAAERARRAAMPPRPPATICPCCRRSPAIQIVLRRADHRRIRVCLGCHALGLLKGWWTA